MAVPMTIPVPPGPGTAAAAWALRARAAEGPVQVIVLTDEELAVLAAEPAAGPHVAPMPWLDGHDEPARDVALQVALRGLMARGLAAPGDAGTITVHPEIAAAIAMRHDWRAVVLAERRDAADAVTRALYLHPGAVLEETVSPGGLHDLTVTAPEVAAGRLAGFCDPAGTAAEQGGDEPRTVPLGDIAAGDLPAEVAEARHVTALGYVERRAEEPPAERRATVYALEDRVILAEPARTGDTPALRFTTAGPDALRRVTADLIGARP
jgi:hypothetical protein